MPRNRRNREKQARRQIDRQLSMRRRRDEEELNNGNDDNGDSQTDNETQFKNNSSRKEKYRM